MQLEGESGFIPLHDVYLYHPPRLKKRGFEVVKGWEGRGVILPKRGTSGAAGYDFYLPATTEIPPSTVVDGSGRVSLGKPFLVVTGVKAYMKPGEYLEIVNRSSGPKQGLLLANSVGVIDYDYYQNEDNDGHIMFAFWNVGATKIVLEAGAKIGQGIFKEFLLADDDYATDTRKGGFGSTGV